MRKVKERSYGILEKHCKQINQFNQFMIIPGELKIMIIQKKIKFPEYDCGL